jgi:hypothetical protein
MQRTRRTLLRAARGLPRTMSPNNPMEKRELWEPQNRIPLASPLRPPHLSFPLIQQAPRIGLAFCQLVARLLKMPKVIINTSLLFFCSLFRSGFPQCPHILIDVLSNYYHIFVLPLLAFCTTTRTCVSGALLQVPSVSLNIHVQTWHSSRVLATHAVITDMKYIFSFSRGQI